MNLIILSRNPALYSTNSLVSAARKRGHYVRVIDHMRCNLVVEDGNPAIYYQNESLKAVSAVIPRIGSSATEYGSSVVRQFESMDIFTTTRSTALLQSRDKLRCLQILNAHSVDIPKTIMVYDSYSINEMLDHIGSYPVVIKLLNSTQGLGVMLAENQKNAESVVDAFQKIKQKVIIQEFIKESEGCDIRVFIVNGQVIASMLRQAPKGEFRSNLHRGATAQKIKLSRKEEEIALRTVKILGLGVAGVDILRSNRGPLILEVNASPGLEGIEGTTGIDVAGKVIQFVEQGVRSKWKY